ncbi:crossover junction endonuclease MUS81 [Fusarium flagelliforme]|uniref:Crossover junction endonuclease MUS81 n=1 Tax=Fusarium flagelliforme TaxID=2675880 RepID=A0A395MY93_9HYPO|nr:crossover junction endonuclease MUS81 [Fusarium flagelliforme]KAH7197476.1 crossover junction endonuclease MUS81 [Fusarium flagelliforme]RFN52670.1 crossover junction endonuclease mus81 [Fusarium flagelliforme]
MADADSANPQLLAWVKEWLDLARERNSKGVTTYRTAYNSLKACPITFEHPAQLQQLKGFGPKLCDRLEQQLKKHCEQNGLPMPPHPRSRKAAPVTGDENGEGSSKPVKKARKPKAYVPAFRSGAFALVVGLATLDEDSVTGMTKAELIEVAQPYCDSSFSAPSDPTKFYTAWNSMKTLVQKELVYERGRPLRRYALTDEGWEVAKRIKETDHWKAEKGKAKDPTSAQPVPNFQPEAISRQKSPSMEIFEPAQAPSEHQSVVSDGPISEDSSLPNFTPILLPPGSFTVQLVLDVREVRAKTDRDYMQEELAKQGAKPIMRSMELGDAQWVAKCNDPNLLSSQGAEGDEVVLDWIVERKRLDDLIGSIKDGRFHEQKFRLQRSGVKKVIYIIEDIGMDPEVVTRYAEAVRSAIASTQVVNGYFIKRTNKMDETIRYLTQMTKMLKRTYESRTLHVIPTKVLTSQNYLTLLKHLRESISPDWYITYPAFSSLASKSESITLRDVFLKMLMTIKGVTGEKALEIQKRWKTPYDFVKAFEACGPGEQGLKRKRELVFSQTSHLVGRKKFTKPLSTKIAEVWGDA